MKINSNPFYILGKNAYALKNILGQKSEGWSSAPEILGIIFSGLYLLFIDKLIFIEPSMDIISNYHDFCQWYLKIYFIGIIMLSFWFLEKTFLKTELNHVTMFRSLFWGIVILGISKLI